MIKFHELRIGDIVLAEFEGQRSEGEVIELNGEDREVCVQTSVQDFWYQPEHLYPIPLDEDQLKKFSFERQDFGDGEVKYLRGPFRILLPANGGFSHFEMWYREDRRRIMQSISVHELQNHYLQMTKVHLTRTPGVQAG